MAAVQLTTDTLGDLDNGAARLIIDRDLRTAIQDLDDRGQEDGKVRSVTVKVEMVYYKGRPIVTVQSTAALPPRRSNITVTDVRQKRDGEICLAFQQHASDNPEQQTFETFETETTEKE